MGNGGVCECPRLWLLLAGLALSALAGEPFADSQERHERDVSGCSGEYECSPAQYNSTSCCTRVVGSLTISATGSRFDSLLQQVYGALTVSLSSGASSSFAMDGLALVSGTLTVVITQWTGILSFGNLSSTGPVLILLGNSASIQLANFPSLSARSLFHSCAHSAQVVNGDLVVSSSSGSLLQATIGNPNTPLSVLGSLTLSAGNGSLTNMLFGAIQGVNGTLAINASGGTISNVLFDSTPGLALVVLSNISFAADTPSSLIRNITITKAAFVNGQIQCSAMSASASIQAVVNGPDPASDITAPAVNGVVASAAGDVTLSMSNIYSINNDIVATTTALGKISLSISGLCAIDSCPQQLGVGGLRVQGSGATSINFAHLQAISGIIAIDTSGFVHCSSLSLIISRNITVDGVVLSSPQLSLGSCSGRGYLNSSKCSCFSAFVGPACGNISYATVLFYSLWEDQSQQGYAWTLKALDKNGIVLATLSSLPVPYARPQPPSSGWATPGSNGVWSRVVIVPVQFSADYTSSTLSPGDTQSTTAVTTSPATTTRATTITTTPIITTTKAPTTIATTVTTTKTTTITTTRPTTNPTTTPAQATTTTLYGVAMVFSADFNLVASNQTGFALVLRSSLLAITRLSTANISSVTVAEGSIIAVATATSPAALRIVQSAINAGLVCVPIGTQPSVCAIALAGHVEASLISDSNSSPLPTIVVYAVVGVAGAVIIIAIIFFVRSRLQKRRYDDALDSVSHTPTTGGYYSTNRMFLADPARSVTMSKRETLSEEAIYEQPVTGDFDRSRLLIGRVVGQGEFGMVHEGLALNLKGADLTHIALKVCRSGSTEKDREDFLAEMKIMARLNHRRVVSLIGVCKTEEPVMIVEEFMPNGNLQTFLAKARPSVVKGASLLSPKQLISFATDIAEGMAYISDEQVVHRDLATRNVLVDGRLRCKIGDFGLARDMKDTNISEEPLYLAESQRKLPVKWLAPECISGHLFSSASDVWAFGITLWELFHFGMTPYPSMTATRVSEEVKNGYRMAQPEFLSEDLYCILEQTWLEEPFRRPTFHELFDIFSSFRGEAEKHVFLNESATSGHIIVQQPFFDDDGAFVVFQALHPCYVATTIEPDLHKLLASGNLKTVAGLGKDYNSIGWGDTTQFPVMMSGGGPESAYQESQLYDEYRAETSFPGPPGTVPGLLGAADLPQTQGDTMTRQRTVRTKPASAGQQQSIGKTGPSNNELELAHYDHATDMYDTPPVVDFSARQRKDTTPQANPYRGIGDHLYYGEYRRPTIRERPGGSKEEKQGPDGKGGVAKAGATQTVPPQREPDSDDDVVEVYQSRIEVLPRSAQAPKRPSPKSTVPQAKSVATSPSKKKRPGSVSDLPVKPTKSPSQPPPATGQMRGRAGSDVSVSSWVYEEQDNNAVSEYLRSASPAAPAAARAEPTNYDNIHGPDMDLLYSQ